METSHRYRLLKYLIGACALSAFLVCYVLYRVIKFDHQWTHERQIHVESVLSEAVGRLGKSLELPMTVARGLSRRVSQADLQAPALEKILKTILQENPDLFSVGVAYQPYAFDSKQKLFAPVAFTKESQIVTQDLARESDYTTQDWFKNSLIKGPSWAQPFVSQANQSLVMQYAVPLIDKQQKPLGIAYASYHQKKLNTFLSSLDTGKTGYSFMLSANGTFIAHPTKDFVKDEKRIPTQSPLHQALEKESGNFIFHDALTGQENWIFFKKIPTTGWVLCVSILKNEIFTLIADQYRKHLLWLVIALVIFLLLLLAILTGAYRGNSHRLWVYSSLVSLMLMAAIGTVWFLAEYYFEYPNASSTTITDAVSLQKFIAATLSKENQKDLTQIPTGFFVRAATLFKNDQVRFLAYCWQKVPHDQKIELLFPDATYAQNQLLSHTNRKNDDLLLWDINVRTIQQFNSREFPLDYALLTMAIKPLAEAQNILLVPDFRAYSLTNPTLLPGVAEDFYLPEWNSIKSYFSYDTQSLKRTGQFNSYIAEDKLPELSFNILVRRNFIDPFISYIVPLFIALMFIFLSLILYTLNHTWEPLALVSGMFFVVLYAHLNIRTKFLGQPIVYLEYFFILAYLIMGATILVMFLSKKKSQLQFIEFHQALIAKILYWPIYLAAVFLVTLLFFY